MATSRIQVTEGVGKFAATHSITEDAVTKELQRIVENTPTGVDKSYGTGAIDAGTSRIAHAVDDLVVTEIGGQSETAPGTDTAASGLNGRMQRVAQRLSSFIGLFPTSLGSKLAAASLATADSIEDVARMGTTNETAPTADTNVSGVNGRLQRIAQRLTFMIDNLPTSLGSKDEIGCLPIALSTQDRVRIGATSETPPAGDSSTSGLNGRLQRIAIHFTTLLEALPDLASQTTLTSILGRLPVLFPSGAIPTEIVDAAGDSLDYAVNELTSLLPSSAATTNPTVAKAAAGTLFDIDLYNSNAALRYLKIYNMASGLVVGTSTPVLIFALKPTERFQKSFSGGRSFSAGISWALTTGVAIADTGAVGAGDITALNIGYA